MQILKVLRKNDMVKLSEFAQGDLRVQVFLKKYRSREHDIRYRYLRRKNWLWTPIGEFSVDEIPTRVALDNMVTPAAKKVLAATYGDN